MIQNKSNFIFLISLVIFISCNKSEKDFSNAIGKCYQNVNNGLIIGKIIAIEKHPVYEKLSFRVQDFDNTETISYLPISEESIIDCDIALKLKNQTDSLIGKCAYNKSDLHYIGKSIRVNSISFNSIGNRAEGQFSVTILLEDNTTTDITYPKNLVLKSCK